MKRVSCFMGFCLMLLLASCSTDVSSEADQLFRQGNYREAIEAYDEFLATKPKDIKSLYNRGRAYEELGDLENARKNFISILDLDNENINANLSMGKYWYGKKEYARSINFLDKVIAVDGRVSTAYLLKGRSLHATGDFANAKKNYDQAINFDRKNAEAFLYRGALKVAQNSKNSACQDLNRARALGSEEAVAALARHCK